LYHRPQLLRAPPTTYHLLLVAAASVSRIKALPTALSNGQNALGMSNTNAVKQLRGPKHGNWPVLGPCAAPTGEYGLKTGENGHLARANGAIDGPYCSPAWCNAWRRQCEPLIAGRGGGLGVWSCTSAATRGWLGVLLQFEWLGKTRSALPDLFGHCARRPGRGGA
jgi:hypothetical protein